MQKQSRDFAYDCCTAYKIHLKLLFETMIEVCEFQTSLQQHYIKLGTLVSQQIKLNT